MDADADRVPSTSPTHPAGATQRGPATGCYRRWRRAGGRRRVGARRAAQRLTPPQGMLLQNASTTLCMLVLQHCMMIVGGGLPSSSRGRCAGGQSSSAAACKRHTCSSGRRPATLPARRPSGSSSRRFVHPLSRRLRHLFHEGQRPHPRHPQQERREVERPRDVEDGREAPRLLQNHPCAAEREKISSKRRLSVGRRAGGMNRCPACAPPASRSPGARAILSRL